MNHIVNNVIYPCILWLNNIITGFRNLLLHVHILLDSISTVRVTDFPIWGGSGLTDKLLTCKMLFESAIQNGNINYPTIIFLSCQSSYNICTEYYHCIQVSPCLATGMNTTFTETTQCNMYNIVIGYCPCIQILKATTLYKLVNGSWRHNATLVLAH